MIENKCEHNWQKYMNAGVTIEGAQLGMFICSHCKTILTALEVFQLEALENQNETTKQLQRQIWISMVAVIISALALVLNIFFS